MTDMADTISLKARLLPHLPYLRRHARALAGSQGSGDQLVRAALESVLADQAILAALQADPRVGLFRLLHRFWQPVARAGAVAGREALLLTAVEGFTAAEAGLVLDCDAHSITAAVAAATADIHNAIRSRVLIIEDEPIIAMHLESIATDMGHEVVATAITRDEALAAARQHQPGLVLADVQLADGSSGIDAVADILAERDLPVVFITAYPERLLTGEYSEPTYLVTKPFQTETVFATVGQALLARQDGLAPAA